jgi:hypothetical protein
MQSLLGVDAMSATHTAEKAQLENDYDRDDYTQDAICSVYTCCIFSC